MIFDDLTRTRLLGSIDANRLVLLCGAGLSIPEPSYLLSAVQVSRTCYDKYLPIMALPAAMRDDVEQLAGHFYSSGEFESVFLGTLCSTLTIIAHLILWKYSRQFGGPVARSLSR